MLSRMALPPIFFLSFVVLCRGACVATAWCFGSTLLHRHTRRQTRNSVRGKGGGKGCTQAKRSKGGSSNRRPSSCEKKPLRGAEEERGTPSNRQHPNHRQQQHRCLFFKSCRSSRPLQVPPLLCVAGMRGTALLHAHLTRCASLAPSTPVAAAALSSLRAPRSSSCLPACVPQRPAAHHHHAANTAALSLRGRAGPPSSRGGAAQALTSASLVAM